MKSKRFATFLILTMMLSACDNAKKESPVQPTAEPALPSTPVQHENNHPKPKNSVDLNSLLAERSNIKPASADDIDVNTQISTAFKDPITALNELRSVYGLNYLYPNQQLAFAAQKHAQYLVGKDNPSHFEIEGLPGFFEKDPMNRALKAKYSESSFSVGEVFSFYDGDRKDDLDKFLVAIYHRFLVLEPKYNEVGSYYIKDGKANIMEIMLGVRSVPAQSSNVQYAYYPYDKQINVPVVFYPADEIPNPLPERQEVGYPVSFQISSGATLAVKEFKLLNDKGQALDGKMMTKETDNHLTASQFGFIPYNKLESNKRYYASINATINGMPVRKEWSFTTKQDSVIKLSLSQTSAKPGDVITLKYEGLENRVINTIFSIKGSSVALVKTKEASEGKLQIDVLSGCLVKEGCDVLLTVSGMDNRKESVWLKVYP